MEKVLLALIGIAFLSVLTDAQDIGRMRRLMLLRQRELALRRGFPFGMRGIGGPGIPSPVAARLAMIERQRALRGRFLRSALGPLGTPFSPFLPGPIFAPGPFGLTGPTDMSRFDLSTLSFPTEATFGGPDGLPISTTGGMATVGENSLATMGPGGPSGVPGQQGGSGNIFGQQPTQAEEFLENNRGTVEQRSRASTGDRQPGEPPMPGFLSSNTGTQSSRSDIQRMPRLQENSQNRGRPPPRLPGELIPLPLNPPPFLAPVLPLGHPQLEEVRLPPFQSPSGPRRMPVRPPRRRERFDTQRGRRLQRQGRGQRTREQAGPRVFPNVPAIVQIPSVTQSGQGQTSGGQVGLTQASEGQMGGQMTGMSGGQGVINGEQVTGQFGGSTGGSMGGQVPGSMSGTMGGPMGGSMGGAMGGPMGGSIGSVMGGTMGGSMGGAMGGPMGGSMGGAMGGPMRGSMGGAMGGPMGGSMGSAMGGPMTGTMGGAMGGSMGGAMGGPMTGRPMGGAMGGPMAGTMGSSMGGAMGGPMVGRTMGGVMGGPMTGRTMGGAMGGPMTGRPIGGAMGGPMTGRPMGGAIGGPFGGQMGGPMRGPMRGPGTGPFRGPLGSSVGGSFGSQFTGPRFSFTQPSGGQFSSGSQTQGQGSAIFPSQATQGPIIRQRGPGFTTDSSMSSGLDLSGSSPVGIPGFPNGPALPFPAGAPGFGQSDQMLFPSGGFSPEVLPGTELQSSGFPGFPTSSFGQRFGVTGSESSRQSFVPSFDATPSGTGVNVGRNDAVSGGQSFRPVTFGPSIEGTAASQTAGQSSGAGSSQGQVTTNFGFVGPSNNAAAGPAFNTGSQSTQNFNIQFQPLQPGSVPQIPAQQPNQGQIGMAGTLGQSNTGMANQGNIQFGSSGQSFQAGSSNQGGLQFGGSSQSGIQTGQNSKFIVSDGPTVVETKTDQQNGGMTFGSNSQNSGSAAATVSERTVETEGAGTGNTEFRLVEVGNILGDKSFVNNDAGSNTFVVTETTNSQQGPGFQPVGDINTAFRSFESVAGSNNVVDLSLEPTATITENVVTTSDATGNKVVTNTTTTKKVMSVQEGPFAASLNQDFSFFMTEDNNQAPNEMPPITFSAPQPPLTGPEVLTFAVEEATNTGNEIPTSLSTQDLNSGSNSFTIASGGKTVIAPEQPGTPTLIVETTPASTQP